MRERALGPLGTRLFAAFLAVAIASIGTLAAAALIGTRQGLSAREAEQRQTTTDAIATRIVHAYESAGIAATLGGLDYSAVNAVADAASVRYVVRDASNAAVATYRMGNGMGAMMGMMQETSGRWSTAELRSGSTVIGSVSVGWSTPLSGSAQTVAWGYIGVAAVVALLAAFLLAIVVSRRIARPLLRISDAAQRFAGGDRTARTDPQDAAANWELGQLARAFDATADNVVRSEQARRRIAADAAHELRTPLTVLQAGLEELRDGLVAPDPEHVAALHAQAVRLGRIVDDLAALAAAETAALSLRPSDIDLAEVARDAYRAAATTLANAGLSAHIDAAAPAPVYADADRMHQAVANLLSNAARHCRPGDDVTLRVGVEGNVAVLEVADSGPGVPDAEIPHLFERLWRGSAARATEGSGIGLAVVRELVEAQHGSVEAARNERGGLTITLRMPAL